ncbi:MAG: NAD(P)H-dependent oxidoreductase [Nitrospinota bacterium]
MKTRKRVLLLVGSPKKKSTSLSLGDYLVSSLSSFGVTSTTFRVVKEIYNEEGRARMVQELSTTDILILASPLYVDSLPAPVIKTLELICSQRKVQKNAKKIQFCSILNCGFPESQQNDVAFAICRLFARDSKMQWVGGLSIGEGGVIGGEPFRKKQFMYRKLTRALEMSAEALSLGKVIPYEARALTEKTFIPPWLYIWVAERSWRSQAKKNGVLKKLADCPYK